MRYKELYKELAQNLTELGISVCDHDLMGGYCFQTKTIRGFIVIRPEMNYKHKFFTLSHEAGHLFYMKNGVFNWSEKPRSEEEAHLFALQLLKFNKIESHEYYSFYRKAIKSVKNRKKSWFEI